MGNKLSALNFVFDAAASDLVDLDPKDIQESIINYAAEIVNDENFKVIIYFA